LIQSARDALLGEVSYLSSRNVQLEEQLISYPIIQEDLMEYKRKNDMLLVMLGEKEEEYEALSNDMREVKSLYRNQLDELLNRLCETNSNG
jgi:hypothetical protein